MEEFKTLEELKEEFGKTYDIKLYEMGISAMKEIARLNNIIKNLDKMFEYYFLGNLKYDQDTVNTIYVKYIKLKELKEEGENNAKEEEN